MEVNTLGQSSKNKTLQLFGEEDNLKGTSVRKVTCKFLSFLLKGDWLNYSKVFRILKNNCILCIDSTWKMLDNNCRNELSIQFHHQRFKILHHASWEKASYSEKLQVKKRKDKSRY